MICPNACTIEYWYYYSGSPSNPYPFILNSVDNSFLGNAVFAINGPEVWLETSTTYDARHHTAITQNNGSIQVF